MPDGSRTSPASAPTAADVAPAIEAVVEAQRAHFAAGHTLSKDARGEALRAFLAAVQQHEDQIIEALHEDMRRSSTEAYLSEVGYVTGELRNALKSLGKWMRPKKMFSPLAAAPSRSMLVPQPLGLTLIVGPWNYPVQLALAPLVGAVAAGNVCVVKPSELAPASSAVVKAIVDQAFDPKWVAAVEGGIETSQALLQHRWDHIFFTGGTEVGRIYAKAGAEHLSRVTLELGGKSPTIVTPSADLDVAAKRIAWGKWFNTGQTCIAPDYVLAHSSIREALVAKIGDAITSFYGEDPQKSEDYGRIINDRHFARIAGLIDADKVAHGGQTDAADRYIAPTVMTGVTLDDAVMGQEIFGPLLPVLDVESMDEVLGTIAQRPNPLALYLFTTEAADEQLILDRVSFGGGCINNTLLHFSDHKLPFGGVGSSGLGAYHGRHSFDAFSHMKGVLKTANFLDPYVKYPPFDDTKRRILRKLVH
jgi:aldehyde dehydrogenase (NAD+)